jgi:hypothetical protein
MNLGSANNISGFNGNSMGLNGDLSLEPAANFEFLKQFE